MTTWNEHIPIYVQIAQRVTQSIVDGTFPEDQAVPSVRAWAAELMVNPLTVTHAYQDLANRNILQSRRGLGMFVAPQRPPIAFGTRTRRLFIHRVARNSQALEALGFAPVRFARRPTMTPSISVSHLSKTYGSTVAVNDLSFTVHPGQVLGVLGANGSGKTTTLKALLGLIDHQGDVKILNFDTRTERTQMLKHVAFISDTNTLPNWMTALQAVEVMNDLHPNFNAPQAIASLQKTTIAPTTKIKDMSKGMVVQLHLALVLAVNARVLILDEPTLGLDILYRRHFYDTLINEYMTEERTIVITTHQLEEFENLLTDVLLIKDGKSLLNTSVENIHNTYTWVDGVHPHAIDVRTSVLRHSTSLIKSGDANGAPTIARPTMSDIFAALAKESV